MPSARDSSKPTLTTDNSVFPCPTLAPPNLIYYLSAPCMRGCLQVLRQTLLQRMYGSLPQECQHGLIHLSLQPTTLDKDGKHGIIRFTWLALLREWSQNLLDQAKRSKIGCYLCMREQDVDLALDTSGGTRVTYATGLGRKNSILDG